MRNGDDDHETYALDAYPDHVVIDTTYACNVVCGMCPLYGKDFKSPAVPHISIDLIDRMIPLLKRSRSVFLLGRGEPLMHPKIYEILLLLRTQCPRIFITFTSNGVLLTERNITKLLDAKLSAIHISLDGPDIARGHPKFERVKDNIRELHAQKLSRGVDYPAITFGYVIGKDNEASLIETLRFGIEVGIHQMIIEPLRILEPMPEWDDYIRSNNIYNHLSTVVPIVDQARELAAENGIETISQIPTKLELEKVRDTVNRSRMTMRRFEADGEQFGGPSVQPLLELWSPKCVRPFKMMRVEMDGSVYMCSSTQNTGLNANHHDPIAIWNSHKFKELRGRIVNEAYDSLCLDCHVLRNKQRFEAEVERKQQDLDHTQVSSTGLTDSSGKPMPVNPMIRGFIEVYKNDGGFITVSGWAVDLKRERPCKLIILFVDGLNFSIFIPTVRRPDVAHHFSIAPLELSGFVIKADYDGPSDASLRVWALDAAGSAGELPHIT